MQSPSNLSLDYTFDDKVSIVNSYLSYDLLQQLALTMIGKLYNDYFIQTINFYAKDTQVVGHGTI